MASHGLKVNHIIVTLFLGSTLLTQACTSTDEDLAELERENATALDKNPTSPKPKRVIEEQKPKSIPGKGLPLPQKTSYYALKQFMEEYRDVYAAYVPLGKEYRLYFKALNEENEPSDESIAPLKLRIRENFDRGHWVFVGAMLEASEFFLENSKNMLQIDKEDNFIARMKVLTFMAKELSRLSNDTRYVDFTRLFYTDLSERHLGRTVKPREDKKEDDTKDPNVDLSIP